MPPLSELTRNFGRRLRYLRLVKGMTQETLAARSGVCAKHLGRVEHGRSAPSFLLLEKLAQSLKTTPFNFFLPAFPHQASSPDADADHTGHSRHPPDQTMCQSVRLATWIFDNPSRKSVWSDSLYAMLGYAPLSVKPTVKRFLNHVHPDQREGVASFLAEARQDRLPDGMAIKAIIKQGHQRVLMISTETVTHPVRQKHETHVIVRDVTECLALNDTLARDHKELEAFVAARNQELSETVERLQAEARQREKAEQEWRIHEQMVHFSQDAQAYVDAQGVIRAVNRQYAARLGKARRGIIGRDYLELLASIWGEGFVQDRIAPLVRQTLGRKVPRPLLHWLDHPRLGRRYVRATFSPCMAENKVVGLVVTVHDLTELEQARQELEIYKHAVKSSLTPMALADKNHILVKVNPAFLVMWGYASNAECVGRHVSEFHDPSAQMGHVITTLQADGEWKGRLAFKRKDGSRFMAEAHASAMKDCSGATIGYTASFVKITDDPSNGSNDP
jgi:PAS domain S-box-containing protein